MISSIFGKTKPINFIIVLSFLFGFYWLTHFFLLDKVYAPEHLPLKTLVLIVLLFSIFVVNFIVKRNKMTGPNSFAMLFYALLIVVFPETMVDNNAIFCSFFLLLATRKLISMRSLKNLKLKIFDATLWILVCSLFYDWGILYLLMVFAAIYIYEPKNIRNWLVPLSGIFVFVMIAYALLILAKYQDFFIEHYQFKLEFDLAYFLNWGISAKFIVYVLFIFVTTIIAFLKLGKAGLGKVVTLRLMVLSFIIGILLTVLIFSSEVSPLMVTFLPAVVFLSNYVESIKRDNIREVVLISTILIPLLVFVSSLIIK